MSLPLFCFKRLVPAFVAQIENNSGSIEKYQYRISECLIPAVSQLAVNVADEVRSTHMVSYYSRRISSMCANLFCLLSLCDGWDQTETVEDFEPSSVANYKKRNGQCSLCRTQGRHVLLRTSARRVPCPSPRGNTPSPAHKQILGCAIADLVSLLLHCGYAIQTVPFLAELMEDSATEVEQLCQKAIALIDSHLPEGESITSYFQ